MTNLRLQKYLALNQNPSLAMLFEFEKLQKEIDALKQEFSQGIEQKILNNPKMMVAILQNVMSEIHAMKKGDDGYTPEKGKDYFTEQEIEMIIDYVQSKIKIPKDGKDADEEKIVKKVLDSIPTPKDGKDADELIPGIDYPTDEQVKALIYTEIAALFALKPKNASGITKDEVNQLIGKIQTKIDFKEQAAEIARGLETLRGKKQLDYYALKNLPKIPYETGDKKGMLRGGGDRILYYDLSSLCDGATKTFIIPANKRIIWVGGTDVPAGQYRQTTDYTGTGTTTLTLTAQVAAPTTGATLHLIYTS